MKYLALLLATFAFTAALAADDPPANTVVRVPIAQPAEERVGANGSLHLAETQIGDVLVTYGKLIGKKVVADNTVQGQINLVIDQPLSPESGAALIEKALFINGFSLIDAGDDTVLAFGLGAQVRSRGVPVYTSPSEFPKGERVFSYIYKVQHAQALELAGFLQQYIPPSTIESLTPNPQASVLIITGRTSTVQGVIRVLAAVDVTPSPSEAKTTVTEHSDTGPNPALRPTEPFILR